MASLDPQRRERILWFIGMNTIALAIACGLFAAFLYGDPLDVIFQKLAAGVFEYQVVAILIATSPLVASLMVGGAYAGRARRRRRAEADARALELTRSLPDTLPHADRMARPSEDPQIS